MSRAAHHQRQSGQGALHETEQLCRRIVETTHEGIWMANLNGVTTFANPQMARMLGTSPEEMIGRSVFDFVFQEDHATVRQHFAEFLRERAGKRVEERLRRVDRTELWALVAANVIRDTRGEPVSFLGMFTDITERRKAEAGLRQMMDTLETRVQDRTAELGASHQALLESEEKYRQVFETIADGAFLFDGEARRMVEVNEAALRLYGYTREEFLKLKHTAITAEPDDSEATIQLVLTGRPLRIPLRYHRRKDRTIFPVEISASTFRFKGRPVVCGIIRDITQSVELEREILTVSEQEQRRLGQDLHDDLCQQLAGIQFLSQTLASDLSARKAAEATQAREIAQMVQHAMTQTRELARGLSPVHFDAEGLADALRELALRTKNVFRIDCRFRCAAPVLVRDHTTAVHLYRLAQEAVGNAVKHGQAQRIDISLTRKTKGLVLKVSDDGVGIARDLRKQQGMGLQIMHYRAEVMGGSLTVQRQPQGGTAVVCTILEALLPFEGKSKR